MPKQKSSARIQRERALRTEKRKARSRAAKLGHARRRQFARQMREATIGDLRKASGSRRDFFIELIEAEDIRWRKFQELMQARGFSDKHIRNYLFSPPKIGVRL